MQSVDLIIADIDWLITMDASRRVIRDAAIAVDQGKIVAVGKSANIGARYSAKRSLDGRRTVATPGFIDCHLHSSFQLSRGLPTKRTPSPSCSTACTLMRRRSKPRTCACRRRSPQPSCSGTASPASSIRAIIIPRPRSKACWRAASA